MNDEKMISRRSFLKVAGSTGVAVSATTFPFMNLKQAAAFGKHPQEQPPYLVKKKVPQVCARACEADCAYNVVVGVDPVTGLERALTLEGRPEDPVSRGKFCIKGMGFVDSMYDPDRLMVSLKRTNPKKGTDHDPGWVTMKTEDAVNEVIAGLKKVKPSEILFASPGDPLYQPTLPVHGIHQERSKDRMFRDPLLHQLSYPDQPPQQILFQHLYAQPSRAGL